MEEKNIAEVSAKEVDAKEPTMEDVFVKIIREISKEESAPLNEIRSDLDSIREALDETNMMVTIPVETYKKIATLALMLFETTIFFYSIKQKEEHPLIFFHELLESAASLIKNKFAPVLCKPGPKEELTVMEIAIDQKNIKHLVNSRLLGEEQYKELINKKCNTYLIKTRVSKAFAELMEKQWKEKVFKNTIRKMLFHNRGVILAGGISISNDEICTAAKEIVSITPITEKAENEELDPPIMGMN